MTLHVSENIQEAAIGHLRNLVDFTGDLGTRVSCVAGQGGVEHYGPDNPVTLFWAWGNGFAYGYNLTLTIEDGNGNILSPQPAVQNVPVLGGGLFSSTFQWQRHAVPTYDGLATPVLHVYSTNDMHGWTPLRVQDVYRA